MTATVRRGGQIALAALIVFASQAPVAATPTNGQEANVLVIRSDHEVGRINPRLVGFGWHDGGAPLSAVEPLSPNMIRIDARLEDVSTGPSEPLRLADLLGRVQAVRSIDAEPLVILSYVPAWMGEPTALGRDPTRVRPADLDAWEALVHDVVSALATAPTPASYFEAWNEPDIPLFWQDSPSAWLDTVERSARAVAAVEDETGTDLRFGGPATAVPDPAFIVPFVQRSCAAGLPADFVSWHYYGNYPFFGPDGAEFPTTQPIQPVLGRPNPIASPAVYGEQVGFVRTQVELATAICDQDPPELVLDEWNLSAAGFDRRHDTAVGAAFAAGVLVEMQNADLDVASYFRANDTRGVPGEHGAVRVDGSRKPAWWTFDLFQQLAPTQVMVEEGNGLPDDLWALASTDGARVTVLLARFQPNEAGPSPLRIALQVPGEVVQRATVRRIDAGHPDAQSPEVLPSTDDLVQLALPLPGVALVELQTGLPQAGDRSPRVLPAVADSLSERSTAELPATGHRSGLLLALALVLGALVLVLGGLRPR